MVSNCGRNTIRNPQHKSQPIQHCVQKLTIRPPAQREKGPGKGRDALMVTRLAWMAARLPSSKMPTCTGCRQQ